MAKTCVALCGIFATFGDCLRASQYDMNQVTQSRATNKKRASHFEGHTIGARHTDGSSSHRSPTPSSISNTPILDGTLPAGNPTPPLLPLPPLPPIPLVPPKPTVSRVPFEDSISQSIEREREWMKHPSPLKKNADAFRLSNATDALGNDTIWGVDDSAPDKDTQEKIVLENVKGAKDEKGEQNEEPTSEAKNDAPRIERSALTKQMIDLVETAESQRFHTPPSFSNTPVLDGTLPSRNAMPPLPPLPSSPPFPLVSPNQSKSMRSSEEGISRSLEREGEWSGYARPLINDTDPYSLGDANDALQDETLWGTEHSTSEKYTQEKTVPDSERVKDKNEEQSDENTFEAKKDVLRNQRVALTKEMMDLAKRAESQSREMTLLDEMIMVSEHETKQLQLRLEVVKRQREHLVAPPESAGTFAIASEDEQPHGLPVANEEHEERIRSDWGKEYHYFPDIHQTDEMKDEEMLEVDQADGVSDRNMLEKAEDAFARKKHIALMADIDDLVKSAESGVKEIAELEDRIYKSLQQTFELESRLAVVKQERDEIVAAAGTLEQEVRELYEDVKHDIDDEETGEAKMAHLRDMLRRSRQKASELELRLASVRKERDRLAIMTLETFWRKALKLGWEALESFIQTLHLAWELFCGSTESHGEAAP